MPILDMGRPKRLGSMPINADQKIWSMPIDWTKIHFLENIMDRVKELQIAVFCYMPILDMGRPKGWGHRSKPISADKQIRSMLIDWTKINIPAYKKQYTLIA